MAVAALSVVQLVEAEDRTRMCLTGALLAGRLSADRCFASDGESIVHGHAYANVPPGVSVLAIPAEQAVRLPPPPGWSEQPGLRLWAVRLATSGVAFVLCAFLVGRVAEGIAPGRGGAVLVTFALGTLASAVAPSMFDHLPAAAFTFGAFVLAWGRRPLAAGLAAGLALPVEYQSGLVALLIGLYLLPSGARPLGRYLLGLVPGAALIGAYDLAAFGSPFHTSYQYDPTQAGRGLFGVDIPSLHGLRHVLVGERGLLVDSPVLVAAALGLALLWRRNARVEAAVCAAVALLFLAVDSGYFLPYGGASPGPRFVVPALPFLALGLAPAFARFRTVTTVLAAASVVASTAVALTWPGIDSAAGYVGTIWRQLPYLVHGSQANVAIWAQQNVFQHLGLGRLGAAALVFALAGSAFVVSVRDAGSARPRPPDDGGAGSGP